MEKRKSESLNDNLNEPENKNDSFFEEDFYEMLLMSANVWIAFIDEKSRIKTWNRAAEKISGYNADEVVGSNEIWKQLYPDPNYRKSVTKKIIEIISRKQGLEKFETKIKRKDGETRTISWNTKEIKNKSGTLSGYFIIGLDITDIVQLQTNFHVLLMNANVFIAYLDSKSRIKVWNRFAENLTGYNADEVIGSNEVWKQLYPDPEYRKGIARQIPEIVDDTKSIEMFDTEIRTKSGEKRIILWNTKAICDYENVLEGYIVIGLDITREMEMQADIYRYISQAVVRLKYPVEIIMGNLLELHEKLSSDDIDKENALLHINIQIKNAEQILANLYDLNQAVSNSFKDMPQDMKKFLSE